MEAVDIFVTGFSKLDNHQLVRESALSSLEELDFPGRKSEAWKYTRVAALVKHAYASDKFGNELDVTPYHIPELEATRLVFVNGWFQGDLSDALVPGVSLLSSDNSEYQSPLDSNGNIFTEINQAYFTDGLTLNVPQGLQLDKPIHIIQLSIGESTAGQCRHIIQVEQSADATVILSAHSLDNNQHFSNTVIEGHVGANAGLNIIKLQDENSETFSVSKEKIEQAKDSRFSINTITTGGKLVRNDLEISVNGRNCETTLNGAFVGTGDLHIDNHTVVDHTVADCNSSELYKGVLDDNSTGVFNGKVFVRQDAQRINAFQSNGNILLSDGATINTKPELEIYADDVKCSHGTTTGQLDNDALFYLRARGLSETSAKRLLVSAFVKETFENISEDAILNWLNQHLEDRFGWKH